MKHLPTALLMTLALLFAGAGYIVAQEGEAETDAPVIEIREQTFEYIGSRDCRDCHRDATRAHADTPHARTLVEIEGDMPDEENPIVADFSVGEDVRTVTFADETRPFTADDVAFTLGMGKNAQAYVYEGEDGYFVFPAEWHVADAEWVALPSGDDWLSADYSFTATCAGCHAQDVNMERGTWDEDGVMCESCHGPGLDHVEAVDDAGRDIDDAERAEIYALINLGLDSATCGTCHVRGTSTDGVHPFPAGHYPGQLLTDSFTLAESDDTDYFYSTGHARLSYMQYNESVDGAHTNALMNLQANADEYGESCVGCHSVAVQRLDILRATEDINPDTVTLERALEDAPYGVTCATCHAPHMTLEEGEARRNASLRMDSDALCVSCHMDTDDTDGLHVSTMEVYQGLALLDEVPAVESVHFTADEGPTCTSCHMPTIDTPHGERSSHTFHIVPPNALPADEMLTDSCSECHTETPAALADLITDIQADTIARVDAARALVTDDSAAWVATALDAVERDGSNGIHNYAYTDALLDAVEVELGLIQMNGGL
jgi:predicted CXXCH cytochrome family protein